jgi:hypothetical protein
MKVFDLISKLIIGPSTGRWAYNFLVEKMEQNKIEN